ncbi:hypothetical protein C1N73_09150 [Priestia aryabhattai]
MFARKSGAKNTFARKSGAKNTFARRCGAKNAENEGGKSLSQEKLCKSGIFARKIGAKLIVNAV